MFTRLSLMGRSRTPAAECDRSGHLAALLSLPPVMARPRSRSPDAEVEAFGAGFRSPIAREAAVARSARRPADVRSCRWDDLAAWWLSRYKVSTQQTYACYLPRWTAWCAGRGLDPLQAGRADVELWLRSVADSELSRASVAAHYDAVASIYRLAFEEDLIAVNPCARITRPKVLRELQRREVLTVLEYAAFLTAARSLGPTHHVIAVLGGMLGLRASEMAGLTVDSLATVRGYATLTFIGKGDKPPGCRCPCPRCPRCGRPSMTAPAGRCCAPVAAPAWTAARCTATWPAPPRPLASPGPSGHTRSAASSDSTKAFRCETSSACCATPARRPPWPATT